MSTLSAAPLDRFSFAGDPIVLALSEFSSRWLMLSRCC